MSKPAESLEEVVYRLNLVTRALVAGEITDAVAHVTRQCLKDASAAIRELEGEGIEASALHGLSDADLDKRMRAI